MHLQSLEISVTIHIATIVIERIATCHITVTIIVNGYHHRHFKHIYVG